MRKKVKMTSEQKELLRIGRELGRGLEVPQDRWDALTVRYQELCRKIEKKQRSA